MRDDFNDGEKYLRLHGTPLGVPPQEDQWSNREALAWHNENKFRG